MVLFARNLLTLKGGPDKNPPKLKLAHRVSFCLTSMVRIQPCTNSHFLLSTGSEHSRSWWESFGRHQCRAWSSADAGALAEPVTLHQRQEQGGMELRHLSLRREESAAEVDKAGSIPSPGYSATSAHVKRCGK